MNPLTLYLNHVSSTLRPPDKPSYAQRGIKHILPLVKARFDKGEQLTKWDIVEDYQCEKTTAERVVNRLCADPQYGIVGKRKPPKTGSPATIFGRLK